MITLWLAGHEINQCRTVSPFGGCEVYALLTKGLIGAVPSPTLRSRSPAALRLPFFEAVSIKQYGIVLDSFISAFILTFPVSQNPRSAPRALLSGALLYPTAFPALAFYIPNIKMTVPARFAGGIKPKSSSDGFLFALG